MGTRHILFVAAALATSGCSLTLNFAECDSDDDCASGQLCVEAICRGDAEEDAGDAPDSDAGADDANGMSPDLDGGVDEMDAGADMPDIDPNRPTGRTLCPDRPTSDITEPKTTVGNGNAASCTFDELRSAIAGGGLITFECGVDPHTITFTERITIDNDVHIDGGGLITFDGANNTRLFVLDTSFQSESPHLVLEELTLQNGRAQTDDFLCGGAVARPGGTLTIIDSTFDNNGCTALTTEDDPVGGAIGALDGGPLTIFGSEFTNNDASGGGALFIRDTQVTITNTTFRSNEATTLSGGGFTCFGQTDLSVCGSTFEDNLSENFGGGIFYRDGDAPRAPIHIAQTTFRGNVAVEDGGGADLEGAELTIDSSTFDSNVSERGGALWLGGDEFTMTNVTFHRNESTNEAGGAFFYQNSTGTIDHGTFAGNLDSGTPGAVIGSAPDEDPTITLKNTVLLDESNRTDVTMCTVTQLDAGGNVQWPETTEPCTDAIELADPMLGDLSENGGRTATMLPATDSAAATSGFICPRFDQRGIVRPLNECTSGAVQIEQ